MTAVHEIGERVVRWLQASQDSARRAELAAELAGEPVHVDGFLAGLAAAGLLPAEDSARRLAAEDSADRQPASWSAASQPDTGGEP